MDFVDLAGELGSLGADGGGALFGGVVDGTDGPVVLRDLVWGECGGAVRGAGGVVADVGGG